MAGIGFKLRAYTQDHSFTGIVRGYFHAAMVAGGPWLLTVITLVAILWMMRRMHVGTDLFLETIIYIYAFSLLTTAPLQLIATRFLSDKLDARKLDSHIPTMVALSAVSAAIHGTLGFVFILFTEVSWAYRLAAVALFVLVAQIWLSMAFIGSLRAFHLVSGAFVAGTVASIVLAFVLGSTLPAWVGHLDVAGNLELGYLLGMCLGQGLLVAVVFNALAREFEFDVAFNWEWWAYFRRSPHLPLAGFFYYAAIWATLMVYWYGIDPHTGEHVGTLIAPRNLWAYPPMDEPAFYAMLSIIPAVTVFYIYAETLFYENYRGFYNAILARKNLDTICRIRDRMRERLGDSFFNIAIVQLVTTLGFVVFAPDIGAMLGLDDREILHFRVVSVGAASQALFLFTMVVMFYFELYEEAMIVSILAAAVSVAVGIATLYWGWWSYGVGLLAGTAVGTTAGWVWLNQRLFTLEYRTFVSQPMAEEVPFSRRLLTENGYLGRYVRRGGRWLISEKERVS